MAELPPSHTRETSNASAPPASAALTEALRRYWKQNLRIMLILLVIWGVVSLVISILLADWLNQYRLGGFPLGFWFAQQGSIVVFLVLILVYAVLLNALDRRHHREFRDLSAGENH